jgi:hypothetical protein
MTAAIWKILRWLRKGLKGQWVVSCCLECAKFIPHIKIKSNEAGNGEIQHCPAAVQETEWKGERITDAWYFIMFYSRKMVNYISDTGLTSMANQSTQRWDNISGQPQSTSIPVHGRWSTLDTWKVDVWETGVANLHQVMMTSLKEMGQQDTQHECTSDSPPLVYCSGYLPSPFPCHQNRLTEDGPEIRIWNTKHHVTLAAAPTASLSKYC